MRTKWMRTTASQSRKTGTTRTTTSRPQSRTPMTTLTSTIAWRTCTESASTAHLFHSCDCLTLHFPWLKFWAISHSIHGVIHMARSLWLDLSLLPLLVLPVFLRLLPLSRAVPWARQPDRHGKSALLSCRREWGHPELLHLSHTNYNNTEVPADLPEKQASQPIVKVFAARSKAKEKTTKKRTCWCTEHYSDKWKKVDWYWTRRIFFLYVRDFEESNQSSVGWSLESILAAGGEKRRYQYCTDISGTIIYFRALQGHSGRNLIDPSLQDSVIIQSGFFQHIYHICAFNLHSIINNELIPGGQNSSKRQTVFFLPIDPRDKGHQNPAKIDFNEPRRAQYLHSAWKKHQDAIFCVDINLSIRKGLTFYQTRSNAIILQETLPAYCIPKVVRLKTGEVLYEKSYMSPRPPPKISLRHDHDWTRGKVQLGSTVDQRPEGKVVRQSRGEVQHATFSQLTQPIPKPICDRSGQPEDTQGVFVVKGETSRSHGID